MKKFRLGVEYGAPPIFQVDVDQMGHIDPVDLNLSKFLLINLNEWDMEFQKTFCDEYPPDSGFKIMDDQDRHNAQGIELAKFLQKELGSHAVIEFFPLK